MKKYLLLFLIILFPLNVSAKNEEFKIICDNNTFLEQKEFTCRTSINSSFNYNKISFELNITDGLVSDDIRSNHTAMWTIKEEKNLITATTKNNELVNGLQEFGILLFETISSGIQNINLKNVNLINTNDNTNVKLDDIKVEIKVLSNENTLKSIIIDEMPVSNFLQDVNSYSIKISDNQEKIMIRGIATNDSSVITGDGEIILDKNTDFFIIPINVKSESGINRIYKIYLTRDSYSEADEIKASNIIIKDKENKIIDIKFDPNILEYTIEVNAKTTTITIEAILEDSNLSFLKNYGSRSVNIENGENIALIKIKDKNDNIKTYIINITKILSNKSSNAYLKSLNIKDYELKFNKKVKQYKLEVKSNAKKLIINALSEDPKSNVTILGNENLRDGSIIKVVVKAENESKITYQIAISFKEFVYTKYLISAAVILLLAIIANEIIKKQKKNHLLKSASASESIPVPIQVPAENKKVIPKTKKSSSIKLEPKKVETPIKNKKAEIKKKTSDTKVKKAPSKNSGTVSQVKKTTTKNSSPASKVKKPTTKKKSSVKKKQTKKKNTKNNKKSQKNN